MKIIYITLSCRPPLIFLIDSVNSMPFFYKETKKRKVHKLTKNENYIYYTFLPVLP